MLLFFISSMISQPTEDLLAVVFDQIAWVFNKSGATSAIALGISNVFDKIWHASFLHKIKLFGVSSQIFGLHKRIHLMIEILKALFLVLYINDLPDDVICNIANYADNTTLYSRCH